MNDMMCVVPLKTQRNLAAMLLIMMMVNHDDEHISVMGKWE